MILMHGARIYFETHPGLDVGLLLLVKEQELDKKLCWPLQGYLPKPKKQNVKSYGKGFLSKLINHSETLR